MTISQRTRPVHCRALPSMAASLAIAASIGACHHGSSTPPVPVAEGGALGDSAVYGARFVDLNETSATASYWLAAPAYVITLAVVPGLSIDRIVDGSTLGTPASARRISAGRHRIEVALPAEPQSVMDPASTPETRRCVAQAIAANRARKPQAQPVKRDSTGRAIETAPQPMDRSDDMDIERRAESSCAASAGRGTRAPTRRLHDGYLLLLASDIPLTENEIAERLHAFSVTADDVPGAMRAIGQGLFAARRAVWSGYYVRW
jgi:hypothetical protein